MGDVTAESLTIVGAFAPSLRSSTWLTLDLAEREFRESGMPSSAGGAAPLMLVLCDDAPLAIQPSMEHLVVDLGARAILASFDESVQPASLLTVGDRAFMLSPDGSLGGAPSATYWHLGGDYGELVRAYPSLLRALVRRLGQRTASTGRPSRVAVVTSPGEGGRVGALVSAAIEVDGEARQRLRDLDRFRSFELSDADRERSVADLLAYAPDLVLMHAAGVFGSKPRRERAEVIGRLEEEAAAAGRPLPLYAIGPRLAGDAYLDGLAAGDPSFRARAVLVDLERPGQAEEAGLRSRFAAAYDSLLPGAHLAPAPRIYDALYYLAYAAAAGRDASALTVSSLRRGMALVTDGAGPAVHVGDGSDGLDLARELLLAREPFDLQGITGAGPFDPARGLRPEFPVIYCWGEGGVATLLGRFDGATWSMEPGVCASEAVDGPLD
jgi:hypothetical protein